MYKLNPAHQAVHIKLCTLKKDTGNKDQIKKGQKKKRKNGHNY